MEDQGGGGVWFEETERKENWTGNTLAEVCFSEEWRKINNSRLDRLEGLSADKCSIHRR